MKKQLKLIQDYAEAHNNLGTSFIKLKKYKEAKNCFDKAILIDPKLLIIYAFVSAQLGDNQNSLNCFKKVIELDPKNFTVHYHSIQVLKQNLKMLLNVLSLLIIKIVKVIF